jgi:arginyl-tRNA--protein-N-Asp/Glu arginylyltransferase
MQDELGKRQFFITPAHTCSYLPKREANTLFLDPRETITPALYSDLTRIGFRRSGGHLYRPHCNGCNACVPTRIPVATFSPRRRHRRVLTRNADLRIVVEPAAYNQRYYELYASYINARHRDGDMYPPSADQYRTFLLSQWSNPEFLCVYEADTLRAVAVTDRQLDGLSAIYTFFDPTQDDRGLGVFCILKQIEQCVERGLQHLYLGYWIKESDKMRYKTDYRPVELFVNERWITLG